MKTLIYDVSQHKLVLEVAKELKNKIKMPEWALFVKTGSHRETMPKNADWWYIRASSILRLAHKMGPIGVNKLKTRYGGRKNRGVKPDAFQEASGKVIRVILQQLQEAGLVKENSAKAVRKGRIATPEGISIMMKCAKKLLSENKTEAKPKKVAKKVEEVPETIEEEITSTDAKSETPVKED
ncbi:MAG: 30S ribosomal protein S19e [Candidatus Nanoarchaeia archaeon]|nr:30S ribosomal protein S19e [Candidatus Nanoarchaeia archaeon]